MLKFLDNLLLEHVRVLKSVRDKRLDQVDAILRELEDDGLIEWHERAWALTEAGKFAVARNTDPNSGAVVRA